jgi:hypothetical protein
MFKTARQGIRPPPNHFGNILWRSLEAYRRRGLVPEIPVVRRLGDS